MAQILNECACRLLEKVIGNSPQKALELVLGNLDKPEVVHVVLDNLENLTSQHPTLDVRMPNWTYGNGIYAKEIRVQTKAKYPKTLKALVTVKIPEGTVQYRRVADKLEVLHIFNGGTIFVRCNEYPRKMSPMEEVIFELIDVLEHSEKD